MSAPLFNPYTAALAGLNLIEASAGTGKTYNIAALYIRLVIERGLTVDQILVLTYTEAATAELRDRIHRRLGEMQRALEEDRADDSGLLAYARSLPAPSREAAALRLRAARSGFDEASIHTIHSFCARVLRENAFASGIPFEMEMRTDTEPLIREIVQDFWRREMPRWTPTEVEFVESAGFDLEKLYDFARIAAHFHGRFRAAELPAGAVPDAAQRCAAAWARLKAAWPAARAPVEAKLRAARLNRTYYGNEKLDALLAELSAWLAPAARPAAAPPGLLRLTPTELAARTNKGGTAPVDPFFDGCDAAWQAEAHLAALRGRWLSALNGRLAAYLHRELPRRQRRANTQGFDDLLRDGARALGDPAGGQAFAQTIRRLYPVALVDEFQDTDLVQYDIFKRIYADAPDSARFYIGDPKQSIYSFRAADVYSYLIAKRAVGPNGFTLQENWRSEPELIAAVNRLFMRRNPFLIPEITFQPARDCGRWGQDKHPLTFNGACAAPMTIWHLAPEPDDASAKKYRSKESARALIAAAIAAETARLLAPATGAAIGRRPLRPSDIAVLVRTHFDGDCVRAALQALGIPCVTSGQTSVFDTEEAADLELGLQAVAQPERESAARAALLTTLFGQTARAALELAGQENAADAVAARLRRYHEIWTRQGVLAMLHRLIADEGSVARCAAMPDRERRLTNLFHLAELLQQEATRSHLGVPELIKWFARRRTGKTSDQPDSEGHLLRLESDGDCVQIATIHSSKGLQYPVVFLASSWEGHAHGPQLNDDPWVHPARAHDPADPTQVIMDTGSPDWAPLRRRHAVEERAENLRLLYVAITRAIHRAYLIAGRIRSYPESALAYLLHQSDLTGADLDEQVIERIEQLDAATLRAEIFALAQPGVIAVADLPDAATLPYQPETASATTVFDALPVDPARIARDWRVTSSSGIAAGEWHAAPGEPEHAEESPAPPAPAVTPAGIHAFPRGTVTGHFFHALFEQLDFTRPDEIPTVLNRLARRYRFPREYDDAINAMARAVLELPLADGARLTDRPRTETLRELEFYFPVGRISGAGLTALLRRDCPPEAPALAADDRLTFDPLRGMMKGYMDLVFRHKGRFYLVDYKSNCLGPDLTAYTPRRLRETMAEARYTIQYLIYTVALHRFLRTRLPDYRYERDFGGVHYLFLRGAAAGPAGCVFFDRPAPDWVTRLDRYFAQGDSP